MDFVNYKGRPLTKSVLQDIVTLFTLAAKNKPIPKELVERLYDDGVEIPRLLTLQK